MISKISLNSTPGACRRTRSGFEWLVLRLVGVRLHRRYIAISPASPSLPVTKPLTLGPATGSSDRLLVRALFPVITAGFGVECWWCLVISLFFLPQPFWLRSSYGSATALYPDDLYTIISQACNKKGTIYITLKCEDLAKEFNLRVQRMQLKEGEAGRHETIVRASM